MLVGSSITTSLSQRVCQWVPWGAQRPPANKVRDMNVCKMIMELQSDIWFGSFEPFQLALAPKATSQRHLMCTEQEQARVLG